MLMGPAPILKDVSEELATDRNVTGFNKRLGLLLNSKRLSDIFPSLMEDIQQRMVGWGTEGQIDPFQNIYDLVVQMTLRMTTCNELAKNYDDIHLLQKYYLDLQKNLSPVSLLLPWFPSIAKRKKEISTAGLYTILKKYVDMRRIAESPSSDAIDVLLSKGEAEHEIIGFILSIISAGVFYTGMIACWSLIYLASNPEWMKKVKAEINELIALHTDSALSDPHYKRLSEIPIAVWEDEMPVVDIVVRETIRLSVTGTALRQNITEYVIVDGHRIEKGEFMAYSIYDSHMNPDIYQNPSEFDPDRYSTGREEDKRGTYAFLGWGAGRHPCTGTKIAKLEIKAILALFLSTCDYEIVDRYGNYPKCLPRPDYNDIHTIKPVGEPCFFHFKKKLD
ncbi:cytochrome P450 [Cyathus striatus]|nr:cytochrome P450 [Cyathus striatus]